jgi:hypothetical protein
MYCPRAELPASEQFKDYEAQQRAAAEASVNYNDIGGYADYDDVYCVSVEAADGDEGAGAFGVVGPQDMVLDTGCEARGVFSNKELLVSEVASIEVSPTRGIESEVRALRTDTVGVHEHFGVVKVCSDARVNVLSACAVMDDHDVKWSKEAAIVTVKDGTVYTFRRRDRLYVCNVNSDVCRVPVAGATGAVGCVSVAVKGHLPPTEPPPGSM